MLRYASTWNGLLVLNYHRIGNPDGSKLDRGVFSATQEEFDAQIRFLRKEADIIQLADIEHVLTSPRRRGVLLTFDDGYRDNYELAFPVLKQHGASAVFFLTSGFLDNGFAAWWDEISWMVLSSPLPGVPAHSMVPRSIPFDDPHRQRAIQELLRIHKQLPWDETVEFRQEMRRLLRVGEFPLEEARANWMTWDMVREMSSAGMELGGHTVTHPVLANLDRNRQQYEINESKARIEREARVTLKAFSYPVGQRDSFTVETELLLRAAGYEYGFSFFGGLATRPDADRLALPRVSVELGTNPAMFRSLVTLPQIFAS